MQVSRRFEHSRDAFRRVFGELEPEPISVALEATYGWGWFADLLADAGIEAHMAHPLATKAIGAGRVKNDAVDAATLAHLLRTKLLPEAWTAPPEVREFRRLVRMRESACRCPTFSDGRAASSWPPSFSHRPPHPAWPRNPGREAPGERCDRREPAAFRPSAARLPGRRRPGGIPIRRWHDLLEDADPRAPEIGAVLIDRIGQEFPHRSIVRGWFARTVEGCCSRMDDA